MRINKQNNNNLKWISVDLVSDHSLEIEDCELKIRIQSHTHAHRKRERERERGGVREREGKRRERKNERIKFKLIILICVISRILIFSYNPQSLIHSLRAPVFYEVFI